MSQLVIPPATHSVPEADTKVPAKRKRGTRNFIITFFWNGDEVVKTNFITNFSDLSWVKFCRMNPEICPDTGRPHLQVALITRNAVLYEYIVAKAGVPLGDGLEAARSIKRVISYCGKMRTRDGETMEVGEFPKGQGNRRDTDWALRYENTKRRRLDVAKEDPEFVTLYREAFAAGREIHSMEDSILADWKVIEKAGLLEAIHEAKSLATDRDIFICPRLVGGESVWRGYDRQPVVILDEGSAKVHYPWVHLRVRPPIDIGFCKTVKCQATHIITYADFVSRFSLSVLGTPQTPARIGGPAPPNIFELEDIVDAAISN